MWDLPASYGGCSLAMLVSWAVRFPGLTLRGGDRMVPGVTAMFIHTFVGGSAVGALF